MILVAVGIFICIQILVLIFVLALSRSAAISDKQVEKAILNEQVNSSSSVQWVESQEIQNISPDTKPSAHFEYTHTDT